MPLIHISMIEGRTPEMKHRLIKEVSDACAHALEIPVDRVRVAIHEMSTDDFGVGGVAETIARRST